MRTKTLLAVATSLAMALSGCASKRDLAPTRAVAKKDIAACNQVAERAANDPARQNNQTAVMVGSAIGGGLIGLVTAAAVNSNNDQVMEAHKRNECLSRKGYKLVPKKTE